MGRRTTGRRTKNGWNWTLLLIGALLLSGCVGWAGGPDDGSRRGVVSGRAVVQIGGHSFPLYDARVLVTGSYSGTAYTMRDGAYRYARLAPGRHKLTLQALHGHYESSVFIEEGGRPQTVNWRVRPQNLDPELFFQLSGLKRLYIDDWGRVITDPGTLVRWEKSLIRVYFDESGAPGRLPAGTVAAYMAELRRWEGYLDRRYTFIKTDDEARADIAVYWVPEGSLFDHAGIARHVAFYANGALKRVEIEIDIAYATFPGLWEHEFAHAMGADHVADTQSVLYPFLRHGQRTTLSSRELAHVRLMYDIPSGQELGRGAVFGAMVAESDDGLDAGRDFGPYSGFDLGPDPGFESGHDSDFDSGPDSGPDSGLGFGPGPGPGPGPASTVDDAFDDDFAVESVDAGAVSGRREHILRIDPSLMDTFRAGQ